MASERRYTPAGPASRIPVFRVLARPAGPASRILLNRAALHQASGKSATELTAEVEQAYFESMNEVSNQVLDLMLEEDGAGAVNLVEELQITRRLLEAEGDVASSRFLKVFQGMLSHTLLKEAADLEGIHATAFNRLCNQVAGSEWKLVEEGKRVGVDRAATPAEIKSAYRKLALKIHPDVSEAADANERFAELSAAYDVLSDAASREIYDKYGMEGLARRGGIDRGKGNASKAWDEFKPHVRENKRTRARGASAAASPAPFREDHEQATGSGAENADVQDDRPQVGAVVEYPLRDTDCTPGRHLGVGLLVGRNLDRGDAKKLPPEQLDLCEVEPLQQQEPDSNLWIPDQLGYSSFARLGDLRVIPVSSYDQRYDIWSIEQQLSPGCSGPELPDEVIL
ncbi:hypothetical protein WJX73_005526 [Symbiochloris irregularis]|uniref:J domain-containing protein n=1 Tax=Symbiochloris irregularis TaxID=706552 RepID=A0AAW1P536_9CHLO